MGFFFYPGLKVVFMNDQKCCCVNVLFYFFEEKTLEFSPQ